MANLLQKNNGITKNLLATKFKSEEAFEKEIFDTKEILEDVRSKSMGFEVPPNRTRPDPNNPGKTIPKTFGVWDVGTGSTGKRYRYGNNPVRGKELVRDYGRATMVGLFTTRSAAKSMSDSLN